MLIQALQDLQHHHGYLPREALHELAERLKVPFFEVYGVASSTRTFDSNHSPARRLRFAPT